MLPRKKYMKYKYESIWHYKHMTADEWYKLKSQLSEKDIWVKVDNKGKRKFKGNICVLRSMTNPNHLAFSHKKMDMLCVKDEQVYLPYKYGEKGDIKRDRIVSLNKRLFSRVRGSLVGPRSTMNNIIKNYINVIQLIKRQYEK